MWKKIVKGIIDIIVLGCLGYISIISVKEENYFTAILVFSPLGLYFIKDAIFCKNIS